MINYKIIQEFYFHIKNPIKKENKLLFLFLIFHLDFTTEKGMRSFFLLAISQLRLPGEHWRAVE